MLFAVKEEGIAFKDTPPPTIHKEPRQKTVCFKAYRIEKETKDPAAADPDQDLSPYFARNFMDLFCYLTLLPQESKNVQQLLCPLNKHTGSRMISVWIFGKLL